MDALLGTIARYSIWLLAATAVACDPQPPEPECTAWSRSDDGKYTCTSTDPRPCAEWGYHAEITDAGVAIVSVPCVRREGE